MKRGKKYIPPKAPKVLVRFVADRDLPFNTEIVGVEIEVPNGGRFIGTLTRKNRPKKADTN